MELHGWNFRDGQPWRSLGRGRSWAVSGGDVCTRAAIDSDTQDGGEEVGSGSRAVVLAGAEVALCLVANVPSVKFHP